MANPVFAERAKSIFPTMTALARAHGAINLGQGFPDEDGPPALLERAAAAVREGPNQYAPPEGVPALRAAVAKANRRFYGLDVDPETQVIVTGGATIGLGSAFLALCQPGDDVIVFAPFYECYAPQIEAAGARPVYVHLEAPGWRVDRAALNAAITPKTRAIVFNSPHNPTARVADEEELIILAEAARAHDLVVLCDEVYEHMCFDGRPHRPLMTLPGMADRTVRFGSAGKTFSVTGWRIGYATGPADLIGLILKAHQFLAYTTPAHLQTAVAAGLGFDDAYFDGLAAAMQMRRDRLTEGLKAAGFDVQPCEGSYFLNVDIRSVGREDDVAFCREITEKAGVAAVPVSAFYAAGDRRAARRYARFCFAKQPAILDDAAERLRGYFAAGG